MGTLRTERKAACVIGVDEFVVDGRNVGEKPEPAEGINLLEGVEALALDRGAADAVKAVAAGNVVAVDAVGDTVLLIGDIGRGTVEIMRRDVGGIVDRPAPVAER